MSQENEDKITIEEAIQRLKWEIIAQDWSLSIKRISLLEEAFQLLKQHYTDRRPAHNMLIMADSLLRYIKDQGDRVPSESIDFLKEAMAHIVNIYETEDLETEKEEHLFKILYFRFNKLKEKIKFHRSAGERNPANGTEGCSGEEISGSETDEDPFNPEGIDQINKKISSLQIDSEPEDDNTYNYDIESLVSGLQATLDRAEVMTVKLRQALSELRGLESIRNSDRESGSSSPIKKYPPIELREIVIEGRSIYIQESTVAGIRRLPSSKISRYRDLKSVPIKDLARPFKRLSKQFTGILGSLEPRELKDIALPVIVPQDPKLPDYPDRNCRKAIIISKGSLAGVLLCSDVGKKTENMIKLQINKNGDTIGTGYTEQEKRLRVINATSVLDRDGMIVT
ncbi:MAG: hypothetical protein ACLFV2_07000 [Desulfurivibrionaceae bacterium]